MRQELPTARGPAWGSPDPAAQETATSPNAAQWLAADPCAIVHGIGAAVATELDTGVIHMRLRIAKIAAAFGLIASIGATVIPLDAANAGTRTCYRCTGGWCCY